MFEEENIPHIRDYKGEKGQYMMILGPGCDQAVREKSFRAQGAYRRSRCIEASRSLQAALGGELTRDLKTCWLVRRVCEDHKNEIRER